MSTFLPRVGILESRIVSGARSAQSAKRKRWVCPQCQFKGVQQRRRVVALDPSHQLYRKPATAKLARGLRNKTISSRDEIWSAIEGIVREGDEARDTGQRKDAELNKPDGVQSISPQSDKWYRPDQLMKEWAESEDATLRTRIESNEASGPQTISSQPEESPAAEEMLEKWLEPDKPKDTPEDDPDEVDMPFNILSSHPRIHSIDYQAGVSKALRSKDPELLLQSLAQATADPDYICSLPGPTFTQILTLLDPDFFILPFREVHQNISPDAENWLELVPLRRILNSFTSTIENLVKIRTEGGQKLSLTDYRLRLRCAASAGNLRLALRTWSDMTRTDTKPDAECYNYMLEALVENRHFLPESRHRERVIPHFLKWREIKSPIGLDPRTVRKHWWPSQSYSVGAGGIRSKANDYFREMLHNDYIPDEKTFACLIAAYAKEGSLKGVHQILLNVWNVPETITPGYTGVKPYPRDSPLFPSERLLTAIAHAFGINNDVPKAMQLVDHISRGYDLEIPARVWELFLEWTFVLSRPRSHAKIKSNLGVTGGMMPGDSIAKLWQTMIAPPYNVTPTLPMYDYLIKSYHYLNDPQADFNKSTSSMLDLILEAAPLLETHRTDLLRANVELIEAEELAERDEYPYSLRVLKRKVEALDLLRRRNHLTVRKWHYLFLRRMFFTGQENLVPSLVRELLWCMPDYISYDIKDVGRISFSVRRTDEEQGDRKKRFSDDERLEHYKKQAVAARRFLEAGTGELHREPLETMVQNWSS